MFKYYPRTERVKSLWCPQGIQMKRKELAKTFITIWSFTIVIFIHYKPRIAIAILDL